MPNHGQRPPLNFVRELCRDLPPDKAQEAEDQFWQYLETVYAIFDRLEREKAGPHIPADDSTTRQPTL